MAKYFEPVELGITSAFTAPIAPPVLGLIENILQPHDGGGRCVARPRESRTEKLHRESLLDSTHTGERHAAMICGGVIPPVPFVVGRPWIDRVATLVSRQAVEPCLCRKDHPLRGRVVHPVYSLDV